MCYSAGRTLYLQIYAAKQRCNQKNKTSINCHKVLTTSAIPVACTKQQSTFGLYHRGASAYICPIDIITSTSCCAGHVVSLHRIRAAVVAACSGGPFELVSCPHYLGEIVIYAGLAILAATETPLVLLIFLWVVSLQSCYCLCASKPFLSGMAHIAFAALLLHLTGLMLVVAGGKPTACSPANP